MNEKKKQCKKQDHEENREVKEKHWWNWKKMNEKKTVQKQDYGKTRKKEKKNIDGTKNKE